MVDEMIGKDVAAWASLQHGCLTGISLQGSWLPPEDGFQNIQAEGKCFLKEKAIFQNTHIIYHQTHKL